MLVSVGIVIVYSYCYINKSTGMKSHVSSCPISCGRMPVYMTVLPLAGDSCGRHWGGPLQAIRLYTLNRGAVKWPQKALLRKHIPRELISDIAEAFVNRQACTIGRRMQLFHKRGLVYSTLLVYYYKTYSTVPFIVHRCALRHIN